MSFLHGPFCRHEERKQVKRASMLGCIIDNILSLWLGMIS